MTEFVHLHVHSEYSLLDGANRIGEMVDKAVELGFKALAVTDHGVLYGAVEFYKKCKKKGIKPIIGCEVYVAPRTRFDKQHKLDSSPYHLVLLCENETGYQNLMELVSRAYTEGFYNRPRVDRELLSQYHEGLIALSACLAGELPVLLQKGQYEEAVKTALWYQSVFGKEHYYIELQDHGLSEQLAVLQPLVRLSEETGIPLVATNDAHYLTKEDAFIQKVLLCIQTGKTTDDDTAMDMGSNEFYLKSGDEMASLFSQNPSAISNTVEIARRCSFDFIFGQTKLPFFQIPTEESTGEYFRRLCYEGLQRHFEDNPPNEYQERLDFEISVVEKMGYADYYLIVADFVNYAKNNGIPVGPGRGSGAGSLAAYCMGITGIDPIKYQLLFERFLNPERISMPDFDIDFCYERRGEIIDYVIRKYKEDHVAQIITFGTMAARAAVRDVARALSFPYQTADRVAKLIPQRIGITIEEALSEQQELRELYQTDESIKRLLDTARRLEGIPRHSSTHAAGVVITKDPVSSYVPLQLGDGAVTTQYPMNTLEELGLLKMDFLGLRNLTVIHRAQELIRTHHPDFSIDEIPDDDQKVFDMLGAGQSGAVFQFESEGMKRVLTGLKPTAFEDLIAVISLYRPGPMASIPKYITNRHNPEKIRYIHPSLAPILGVTYGCMIYQEQVMQICRTLAGYSYGQSDLVRRAMSKKKADVMEKERQTFLYGSDECVGAVNNGIDEKIATAIFNEMSGFASYAFNKAHAAAYALLSYQTAYLKAHFPLEYFAALLTSVLDHPSKVSEYQQECRELHIAIEPPDINRSEEGFVASGGSILFGLLGLKNLGRNVIRDIVAERSKKGAFADFYDFCSRMQSYDLNKRALEALIKSGSFDKLHSNRKELMLSYEGLLSSLDQERRRNVEGQQSMFETLLLDENGKKSGFIPIKSEDYSQAEKLAAEKEVSGIYLSGHPVAGWQDYYKKGMVEPMGRLLAQAENENNNLDGREVSVLGIVSRIRQKTTRSGDVMAFVTLEDVTGEIEVIVFPKQLATLQGLLREGEILVCRGNLSFREDEGLKLRAGQFRKPSPDKKEDFLASEGILYKKVSDPEKAGLYLKLSDESEALIREIMEILKHYPGQSRVFLYFEREKKLVKISFGVEFSEKLAEELTKKIPPERIARQEV